MQCILIYGTRYPHPFGEGTSSQWGKMPICLAPNSIGRLTPNNIELKMSRKFCILINCFNDRHKITLNCYVFFQLYMVIIPQYLI